MSSNDRTAAYGFSIILLLQAILLPALTIYLGNVAFFSTHLFSSMMLSVFFLVLLLLALLICCRLLGPERLPSFTFFIAALSLLFWVQANLRVRDFGVLDGSSIAWDNFEVGHWVDFCVWLVVGALAFALVRVGKGRLLLQLALVAFGAHVLSVGVIVVQQLSQLEKSPSTYSPRNFDTLSNFSKTENVVHIVMDAFQADVFEELVYSKKYGEYYQNSFDGFVYYREAMGVFPRTKYSVPAFLSGKMYDNSTSEGFIQSTLAGETIVSLAAKNGFDVDIVADGNYLIDHYRNLPHDTLLDLNDLPLLARNLYESTLVLDLVLLRVLPGHLKKWVYNDQKWLFSKLMRGESEFLMYEYFTNAVFLMEFVNRIEATRDKPVYKYIHLFSTHGPKVVGPDCKYTGNVLPHNRDTYTFMANCALNSLAQITNRLKELRIYDDALIIFHADHGGWIHNKRQPEGKRDLSYKVPSEDHTRLLPETIRAAASPLLAIKYPGATGGVTTSNALASLLDIPDTLSDAKNWDGQYGHISLLKLPENQLRRRIFRYYNRERNSEKSDHTGPMADYVIEGSHYEVQWRLDQILMPR